MVKWSMELLGNPNSRTLMEIIAVVGLAQNFAAVQSLITSGDSERSHEDASAKYTKSAKSYKNPKRRCNFIF